MCNEEEEKRRDRGTRNSFFNVPDGRAVGQPSIVKHLFDPDSAAKNKQEAKKGVWVTKGEGSLHSHNERIE